MVQILVKQLEELPVRLNDVLPHRVLKLPNAKLRSALVLACPRNTGVVLHPVERRVVSLQVTEHAPVVIQHGVDHVSGLSPRRPRFSDIQGMANGDVSPRLILLQKQLMRPEVPPCASTYQTLLAGIDAGNGKKGARPRVGDAHHYFGAFAFPRFFFGREGAARPCTASFSSATSFASSLTSGL